MTDINTLSDAAHTVLGSLTAKGFDTMTAIGKRQLSFFDEGVVEGSGIWGECLVGEMGHKSSGVVNRLKALGLFDTTPAGEDDDSDWWALTELGAEVANYLAENGNGAEAPTLGAATNIRVGRKWTTMYDETGAIVAELRNDQLDVIKAYLSSL